MKFLILYSISVFISLLITSWASKNKDGKIEWDNNGCGIVIISFFPFSGAIFIIYGICIGIKKIIEFIVESTEGEG